MVIKAINKTLKFIKEKHIALCKVTAHMGIKGNVTVEKAARESIGMLEMANTKPQLETL